MNALDRPRHRRAPALVGLVVALELVALAGLAGCLVAGCFVDVDLGGSRLSCGDGQCPDGFECVEQRCMPAGQGGQDSGGSGGVQDDAAPAEPDAASPVEDAAPPPDAPPPDAPPPSACDQQYGRSPGYQLCEENDATCTFFVDSGQAASCGQHCADFGGQCIDAVNNTEPPGDVCVPSGDPLGCDAAMNNSLICICSVGGNL
ncbi:MAG TPA: hypothetical protein VKB80_28570 [Kofleriaceae bacterium]|nr:hypothetical protein [Kofleriaceae bacterium]